MDVVLQSNCAVNRESETFVRAEGEDFVMYFFRALNNFVLHFPRGDGLPGFYRQNYDLLANGNRSMRDFVGHEERLFSPRRLNQTVREFYAEIDATVEELGTPMQSIADAINGTLEEGLNEVERDRRHEVLLNMLLPIYITLRQRGYSQFDLFA